MSIVRYVVFDHPGSFFPESSRVRIERQAFIPVPHTAFAWQIEERKEVQHDVEMLVGIFRNAGPRTLIGKKYSLDDLVAEFGHSPAHEILISNVRNNQYVGACLCRTGNWQPLYETDIVLARPPSPGIRP